MTFYASIVLYNLKEQSWVFCWGTSKAVWEKVGGREGKLGLRDSPLRKGGCLPMLFSWIFPIFQKKNELKTTNLKNFNMFQIENDNK